MGKQKQKRYMIYPVSQRPLCKTIVYPGIVDEVNPYSNNGLFGKAIKLMANLELQGIYLNYLESTAASLQCDHSLYKQRASVHWTMNPLSTKILGDAGRKTFFFWLCWPQEISFFCFLIFSPIDDANLPNISKYMYVFLAFPNSPSR